MFTSALRFAFLVAATANLTFAADKPDLSGNWKLDLNNSDFGGAPPPDSFTRRIEHAEPSVILTDEQVSALGPDKAVRKYTTDSKETTYQWMGNEVKSAAHWDGSTLVIVGKSQRRWDGPGRDQFDHALFRRQDPDRERQNRRG